MLDARQATLPKRDKNAGYRTALFIENLTFSTQVGFNHGIDYVDNGIHRKPFVSVSSPDAHVDSIDLDAAITLFRDIGARQHKIANIANPVYDLITEFSDDSKVDYPHHGDRVLDHLQIFTERNSDQSLFCFTNLLDTHNPHMRRRAPVRKTRLIRLK